MDFGVSGNHQQYYSQQDQEQMMQQMYGTPGDKQRFAYQVAGI
jgi:hypothetical protein